jgi:hypothetical protein
VEKKLAAGLSERQIAELVEDDEVHACQVVRHATLTACTPFRLELVDEVDNAEEPPPGAGADAGPDDGDGQMRLARAGIADQNGIALVGDEVAGGEIALMSILVWISSYTALPVMSQKVLPAPLSVFLGPARPLRSRFGCPSVLRQDQKLSDCPQPDIRRA